MDDREWRAGQRFGPDSRYRRGYGRADSRRSGSHRSVANNARPIRGTARAEPKLGIDLEAIWVLGRPNLDGDDILLLAVLMAIRCLRAWRRSPPRSGQSTGVQAAGAGRRPPRSSDRPRLRPDPRTAGVSPSRSTAFSASSRARRRCGSRPTVSCSGSRCWAGSRPSRTFLGPTTSRGPRRPGRASPPGIPGPGDAGRREGLRGVQQRRGLRRRRHVVRAEVGAAARDSQVRDREGGNAIAKRRARKCRKRSPSSIAPGREPACPPIASAARCCAASSTLRLPRLSVGTDWPTAARAPTPSADTNPRSGRRGSCSAARSGGPSR